MLTIAGSDSGGGAGIQADLKAFTRAGVFGTCAVTVVTAQNTRGVLAVHALPAAIVRAQIAAVIEDIGVDAIKIGMLGAAATVRVVASCLAELVEDATPVVIDPVLEASTGATLLADDALDTLLGELLPRATVLTPNLPEARKLLDRAGIDGGDSDAGLAQALLGLGPKSVVLTGGHRVTPGDIYCDADRLVTIEGPRHAATATHGSGCTHSAILAAELAKGQTPLEAAQTAAHLTAQAIQHGLDSIGSGPGPVDISPPSR